MFKPDLYNKKFIISAGASGIGYEIANKIIENGGKVYLTDINQKKINFIKSRKKYQKKIFAEQLNCNNHDDVKKYFNNLKFLKKIDGLINNIGIAGPTKYLNDISIEEWKQTIDTNLNTHFYFCKYAIPLLKKNKSGSIINLSSTAGLYGFPQRSAYAASKWAIIVLTKTLAMELGKFNIRVNQFVLAQLTEIECKKLLMQRLTLLNLIQRR